MLEENYDKFLARLVAAAASLQVGPAEIPGNIIGPVINRDAQERISKTIEAGKSEAKLAWQGSVPTDPNACYVAPTISLRSPPAPTLHEEILPGVPVTRAKNPMTLSPLMIASSLLTGGLTREALRILLKEAEMVCGNLYINRPITGAVVERQPSAVSKMSGGGTKAGGREYLQNFITKSD